MFKNAKITAEIYNNDNDQLEYRVKKLSNDSLEGLLKKKRENQKQAVEETILDKENIEVAEDKAPWDSHENLKNTKNSKQ